jgi:hypothetical protein
VLLAVVIAGLAARYLYLQAKKDVIQAEVRQKKKEELDNEVEMDSACKGLKYEGKEAPKGRNKGDHQFTQVQALDQY